MNKNLITLILIIVAIIIGGLIGYFFRIGLPWTDNATILVIIALAGAFGGILYTLRDSGLENPHRDPDNRHTIKLGWIADCAYGIAGAFVVFLILPTDFESANKANGSLWQSLTTFNLIKMLAIAFVGGYGGRSLVDRALANIAKDAEEAKQTARQTKDKLDQMQQIDTEAMELVHLLLDDDDELPDVQKTQEAIRKASRPARFEIFKEARDVRQANWKKNPALMARSIPIFEALIENDAGETYHRNHGQLAYALKDQVNKDFGRAYKELTHAIRLRDKEGAAGFLMYEFNRAICAIQLEMDAEQIKKDIIAAARRDSLKRIILKDSLFQKWAETHHLNLKEIT